MQAYIKFLSLIALCSWSMAISAQFTPGMLGSGDDDLNIGGDIFSNFNEDLEASQVAEDERFYRYGRFFSFNMGIGLTTFDGNRGKAYDNENPSYNVAIVYFFNFRTAFTLGFAFSKHHMLIDTNVEGYNEPGLIDVNMLRTFMGFKYYIDTADLGTAITYSNPYFVGRMEYWYQTVKFSESDTDPDLSGGGLGTGVGLGLEFPLEIKSSYIGLEVLYHSVNFFDKWTKRYRQTDDPGSEYGYDDLSGAAWSTMVSYNISW